MSVKNNKPICLELFSGSRNVSKFFESKGYNSVSIDNNPILKPSICCDILDLDLDLLPDSIAFLWASPDCSHFSREAKTSHWIKKTLKYRVYDYTPATPEAAKSVSLLTKTIEIINLYPNIPFVIENPIGRIQHMHALKNLGHYQYAVNYGDYDFPYSKETYLFTNLLLPLSTKKVHSCKPGLCTVNSKFQRSKVPPALLSFFFSFIQQTI